MAIQKKIADQFIWRGAVLLTQFAIQLLLARIMGAAGNGKFLLLLNNLSLVILTLGFCLETSAIYYGASGRIPRNVLASFILGWNFIATVASVAFLMLSGHFSQVPVWGQAAFILGFLLINTATGLYQSEQHFRLYNQVQAGINLFFLAWLIFRFPDAWDNSPQPADPSEWQHLTLVYTATVAVQGIAATALYWWHRRKLIFQWPDNTQIKWILTYAGQSLIANLVFFLFSRIDYWIVDAYCSDESLGIYMQATRIGQLLVLPASLLAGILFPHATARPGVIKSRSFRKRFLQVALAYSLVSVAILLFASPVIQMLWGKGYEGIYTPLVITLPGILALALSYLFAPLFAATGNVRWNIGVGLVVLAVVLASNLIAVPRMGINGAALSTSIGFMVMLILNFIIARSKLGLSLDTIPGPA